MQHYNLHDHVLKNFLSNLLSAEGRLNRIGFFYSFLIILFLFVILSIGNQEYIQRADGSLTIYLYMKSLQSALLLALWTPSLIKRLHDLNMKGTLVVIAWAALLLDVHNLMLLNIRIAELLDRIMPVLFVFYALVLIFYLLLFLMPGSKGLNNWGGPQEF